mgnify:FL=1
MKATQLRQTILQSAVQGKLVPQNLHDEPAAALLARIRAEKAKFASEGKFKKEKPLPPLTENEIPYDLPDGWEWCKLGTLGDVQSSKRVFTSEFVDNGIPFYRGTEIGALATGQKRVPKYYITESHYQDLASHTGKPAIGDLLMPSICPDGRIWLVDSEEPFYFKDGRVLWVRLIKGFLNNSYIQQALKARLISDYANIASGTTFAELKIFLLKGIAIPLPPFTEQGRIVAKLNELMALCDELEAAEKKLGNLDSRFAEYLPKSILQAAVQGKLVPHNIHDEPADKLLECIKAEKAKLVKTGKLKKEKPLPPITEDEIPYDLPDGWKWCRLGDVCQVNPRNKLADEIHVSFIPMTLISSDFFGGHQQEQRIWREVKSGFTHFAEGDIVIAKITPCFQNKKSCIMRRLKNGFGAGTTELHVLRPIHVLPEYILIYAKSPDFLDDGVKNMTGTAGQQRVPTEFVRSALIPVPPLAEQQRIVAKVNELMTLCDALKAAHETPVGAPIAATVIPFPHQEEETEMLMAARGAMPKAPSKTLQDARNRLFED